MSAEQMLMPVQRVEGLVITETGDDVLIYDQNGYSLHTLNRQSYLVWQHCDGTATVDAVAALTGMSVDVVKRALTQLEDASLLEASLDATLRSNESRRSFMKKAGIVAIPAIVSVSVPLAQAAASEPAQICYACTSNNQCTNENRCRGNCLYWDGSNWLNINQAPANSTGNCRHK